ncbi:MAG: peroxidase [Rhodospirillaceae bacterium]|nr:peroxidase [Rhodospirillaceae bacterium]
MPFFPSLPENAGVRKLWEIFNPEAHKGLQKFSRAFMRREGMLSVAEKELIAAYVSQLNDSEYCFAGHSRVAINLGSDPTIFEPLSKSIDGTPIREELKPLLKFVKILTLTPSKITKKDADAVLDAGWDEQSFHEAIIVCARFAMMNRITLGHGLIVDEERRENDALNMNYGAS